MSLDWSDYRGIAEALAARHPDTDRMALGLDELRGMILALPDFTGAPQPPDDDTLEDILAAWTLLEAEEDDGAADAYV